MLAPIMGKGFYKTKNFLKIPSVAFPGPPGMAIEAGTHI